jgi:hypothetical protein
MVSLGYREYLGLLPPLDRGYSLLSAPVAEGPGTSSLGDSARPS